jgi:hypothetical protein
MRYIIGFLIGLGLIILLFVMIFRGGNGPAPAPNATQRMVDYANTETVVQYIDDYPVAADQTHRQLVTTVGRDQTTFTIQSGYEGKTLRTQSYPNNATSYAVFLRSLQIYGYTNGDTSAALRDDRGYCPLGHRYIFTIKNGDQNVQRFWATSCGNVGSFKGQTGSIRELYRRQVPDREKLLAGVQLY